VIRPVLVAGVLAGIGWSATAGAAPAPWPAVVAAVAALAAAVRCRRAASRAGNPRGRTAWRAQSLGCVVWIAAPAAWLAGAGPYAAAGRAGFLALAATGFWLTCRGSERRARFRMLLDGGIGAAATVVVAWAVVLAPLADRAAAAALPLAALVLIIFYGFLTMTEIRPGNRRMPVLFMLGLAAIGAADLRLAVTGAPDSAGWLLGFGCIVVAAGTYRGTTSRQSVPSTAAWLAYAPYVPLVLAAATVGYQALGPGAVPVPELAAMAVVVLLVLLRQVLVLAENRTLVARLAARERDLVHQALHCPLTGLGNRVLLTTRLQATLDTGHGFALLFCDLDDFKAVNDTLGHHAGDELLVRVADRLRTALRPADTVVRMGGDEFAVLLDCAAGEARPLADRVWQAFQQPFEVAGRSLPQGASIGLVDMRDAAGPATAADLLRAADLAMYDAKRAGKNGVRVFTPDVSAARSPHRDDATAGIPRAR
jgi:diguanylate cyclase (GGDEF)-like protein